MDVVYITIEGWIWGALNYTYVIFEAGSSEVQLGAYVEAREEASSY